MILRIRVDVVYSGEEEDSELSGEEYNASMKEAYDLLRVRVSLNI